MSGEIKQFPTAPVHLRNASMIAAHLRMVADAIEADELETAPHAVFTVLTGMDQHEALWCGYEGDGEGFRGAIYAAQAMAFAYRRIGGNICPREFDHYGRPLRGFPNAESAQRPRKRSLKLVDPKDTP